MYLLPYFVFLSACMYFFAPTFIYSCVMLALQRDILRRDYEAVDRVYCKTIKLMDSLRLVQGGVYTFFLAEIGRMRLLEGHFESAETYFERALASIHKAGRVPQISKAILHFNLGGTLRRLGRTDETAEHYEKGMAFLKSNDSKTLAFLAFANLSIAALKIDQGDLDGAEKCLVKSKDILDKTNVHRAFPTVQKLQAELTCLSSLTLVLLRKQDNDAARVIGDKFLTLATTNIGEVTSMDLRVLHQIADELLDSGDNVRAEKFLEVAYLVARDSPFHPDSVKMLDCFERLLLITNRKDEVADMRQWLLPIDSPELRLLMGGLDGEEPA